MLGILDAVPDDPVDPTIVEALAVMAGSAMGNAAATLGPTIRGVLGHPAHAFGITPLLIFRQIA